MKYKKITFTLFILLFILLNLSIVLATNNIQNNINSFFRIHVVANSDNISDQILKLQVAQAVENHIKELTKAATTKQELTKIVNDNIYDILSVAKSTILQYNVNYDVVGYIGKIKYDEKIKDGFTMNEGIYDSLKIVIGDGKGENWWSLLFPHSIDSYSTQDIISNQNVEYSFGIFEFISNIVTELSSN